MTNTFKAEYILAHAIGLFEKSHPNAEIKAIYISEYLCGALALDQINKSYHEIELRVEQGVPDFQTTVLGQLN
jgi:hypothetical protein